MTDRNWRMPSLSRDLTIIAAAGLGVAALIGAAATTGVVLLVGRLRNG